MSKRLHALQTEKKELVQRLDSLLEAAVDRDFSDAETADVADIESKLKTLSQRIEREEKYLELQRTTGPDAVATSTISVSDSPRIGNAREAVWDDPKRGFANLGEYALRVMNAGHNPTSDSALMRQIGAAAGTGMTVGTSADGGVLVPPAFSSAIWDATRMASDSLLEMTNQIPIDSGVESITIPKVNETSRANGSRWGGIRGYWKGELTELTSSKPTLDEMKLAPQELYVFAYISDKLLRQAPQAASAVLETAAADEINFKVGDAIINGTGAGQPVGVIGHASVVSVSKETGQAAATIVKENIDKMYARCHAKWRTGAVWLINQDCEPALEQLSAVVGTGGVPIYLPAGGIASAPNARLKGLPVMPVEYCATLGTVGDIMLVNLKAYATAVRGMVDRQYSMHLKFDYAQTAFRLIFEVDGQPMLKSAITPFKGSNTLSPFVTLATRA